MTIPQSASLERPQAPCKRAAGQSPALGESLTAPSSKLHTEVLSGKAVKKF